MPFFLFPAPVGLPASTSSNRTLISRTIVASGPTGAGYPSTEAYRWKVNYLPCKFRYISAVIKEFGGSIQILPGDPSASAFAGRRAGGGTRSGIFGNKRYGSGYPNATTDGVNGRNFPYFFWPISYGQYPGYGSPYIYEQEYGEPTNKHRPGGPLHFFTIQPPKSLVKGPYPELPPTKLYVIGDKPTLQAIKLAVRWTCSRSDSSGWPFTDKVRVSKPKKFKGPAVDPYGPAPEQAVAYYRGSSIVVSLVGYNNTAQVFDGVLSDLEDTPLPPPAETQFFQCINETLGDWIPLVIAMDALPYQASAASSTVILPPAVMMLIALFVVTWQMLFR